MTPEEEAKKLAQAFTAGMGAHLAKLAIICGIKNAFQSALEDVAKKQPTPYEPVLVNGEAGTATLMGKDGQAHTFKSVGILRQDFADGTIVLIE